MDEHAKLIPRRASVHRSGGPWSEDDFDVVDVEGHVDRILWMSVSFTVRHLEADIRSFIDRHNQNPKLFKWNKSADQILASVKLFCHKAQLILCGELWIHVTRRYLI